MYPETTVADVYAKLREGCGGPRRGRKPRKIPKEGEPEEKKIVRAITHPPDARESGIPLASQTSSFLSHGGSPGSLCGNELISLLRLKKTSPRRLAPRLGVRSVGIKSREINANTFYIHITEARVLRATRLFSQEARGAFLSEVERRAPV